MPEDNWLSVTEHKMIAVLVEQGYKIEALKMYRTWVDADLREAKIAIYAIHACYSFPERHDESTL